MTSIKSYSYQKVNSQLEKAKTMYQTLLIETGWDKTRIRIRMQIRITDTDGGINHG